MEDNRQVVQKLEALFEALPNFSITLTSNPSGVVEATACVDGTIPFDLTPGSTQELRDIASRVKGFSVAVFNMADRMRVTANCTIPRRRLAEMKHICTKMAQAYRVFVSPPYFPPLNDFLSIAALQTQEVVKEEQHNFDRVFQVLSTMPLGDFCCHCLTKEIGESQAKKPYLFRNREGEITIPGFYCELPERFEQVVTPKLFEAYRELLCQTGEVARLVYAH